MAQNSPDPVAPEITCREVAERTSAYLEEHVDDISKVRMALHVATCAGCRTYVTQIASVRDVLGRLPKDDATPVQHERLRRAFSARPPGPSSVT